MSELPHDPNATIDPSAGDSNALLAAQFEAAWRKALRGASQPSVDGYLAQVPDSDRTALNDELTRIEGEYRRRLAQACSMVGAAVLNSVQSAPAAEGPGSGGMGVVYKAKHVKLKRTVALKMVLAGGHASDNDLARFYIEAEAVAQLQHPNIVQVFEISEQNGLPFFALEYVDGGSLNKKLDGKPQRPRDAARMVQTLAEAMGYAHLHSIIHRDLKPANILLTSDGQPKITDFGLAKRLEEDSGQTKSGTLMGTPNYMAPEQARGDVKDVGPLADVYALGVILYQMLTGRTPFAGTSILDTIQQVRNLQPV